MYEYLKNFPVDRQIFESHETIENNQLHVVVSLLYDKLDVAGRCSLSDCQDMN